MQRLCVTFSLIDRETQGRLIDLGAPFPANQILPPAIGFYRYASLQYVRTLPALLLSTDSYIEWLLIQGPATQQWRVRESTFFLSYSVTVHRLHKL
jgi:hypothetical protein